ncbi:uncharacterized protein LOC127530802 isoform X2 [Acanthochromis polyacanthus]|uniref:uncharacterized protein LOC127530802 isoform X2 n=1 Tax=Acanthochromis polyacanthus TaxID=80966 RepID=UPI002233F193|nr:uncharacterized protein LOC127530802 isoform X2 [Acanthochromis polyacanthus]
MKRLYYRMNEKYQSDKVTMCSVEYLRELISDRLTAAAGEIFSEFEKTIVQYQEEIDRQRRLLDVIWKPHIPLQPIGETFAMFIKNTNSYLVVDKRRWRNNNRALRLHDRAAI